MITPGKAGPRVLYAVCTIVLLEGALQLGCRFAPALNAYLSPPAVVSDLPAQIRDTHLYQRPTPEYSGHDFRGYRNAGILRRADIVALGDSQTYAKGSPMQNAWPQQLEFLSDQTVYNMSFGGWGPIQYGFLWSEALALQPHTVVIGFHTPDFIDCSLSVYRRGLRREFKQAKTDPLALLVERGILPPVQERMAGIFALNPDCATIHEQQKQVPPTPYVTPATPSPITPVPYQWTSIKVLRVPRSLDRFLFDSWRPYYRRHYRRNGNVRETITSFRAPKVYTEPLPDYFRNNVPTDDVQWVMMIPKRNLEMDITNPFVSEGVRIAVELFADLQQRADEAGVRLVVALLPTKELAFSNFLFNDYDDELPRGYRTLVAREILLRSLLACGLQEKGIETVDVLPGLQACFAEDLLPYPLVQDSHPTPHGYWAIARQIQGALERSPAENRVAPEVDWDQLLKKADPASGHSLPVQTLVLARLIEPSTYPTVKSIFPYKGALITHLYQVEKTLWGQNPGKRILVAHWTIQDGNVLPQRQKKHRIYELTLEPFDKHVGLAREFMVDETTEADAPLFYDILSEPESTATGPASNP